MATIVDISLDGHVDKTDEENMAIKQYAERKRLISRCCTSLCIFAVIVMFTGIIFFIVGAYINNFDYILTGLILVPGGGVICCLIDGRNRS